MSDGGDREYSLEKGSERWNKMRRLSTESIPGRHSALFYLNSVVLQKKSLIPMTYRAHLGMCLFAEGATGIPEIDSARVKLILVPRGVGKTSLVTKALPILRILRDRNASTGIANERQDNANTFLGDIKAEIEDNAVLRALFPEIVPENTRDTIWAADRIIVKRDKLNPTNPSVLAAGVGATVTGVHMGMWILDDLISQNAAENARRGSFTEIEATNRWLVRLQPLLQSPKRDPILAIGTRWWEGDTYEFIEEFWGHEEPRKPFLWSLKLPPEKHTFDGRSFERGSEEQHIKLYRRGEIAVFRLPAIDENGRPLFPERYDLEELDMLRREDPAFYAGQYELEPAAGEASVFNQEWLKFFEFDGAKLRYTDQTGTTRFVPERDLTTFISVDPAFSKKKDSSRTAIPVVGTNGSELFLLEDFADRMDSEDAIAARVVDFYMKYAPQKIFVETIVAQVAVANAIRRRFREMGLGEPPLEEISSHGKQKKVMRIYGMEHLFKRGVFYVHKSHRNFLKEFGAFPRSALRDVLDALAFQLEEWEKVFRMGHYGGGIQTPEKRLEAEQAAMDRVRKAQGRFRRR